MKYNLSPELSERTEEWAKYTVRVIANAAITELRSRTKDEISYMYYNGLKKDEDFDYLNEVGDYTYPAKVRFLQIIRPKIDLQLSKLSRRKLNYATIATDKKSQEEKLDKKLQHYLNLFDEKIEVTQQEAISQIQMIQTQLQEMNKVLNTPAKTQEDAMMKQELAGMRQELQMMLIQAQTRNENIVLLTEEDEEKIDHYWKFKSVDVRELGAKRFLKKAIEQKEIKRKSIEAFKDQCITGKPLYFVDVDEGMKYPKFEVISPLYTCWSGGSPTGYIQDGAWVTYTIPTPVSVVKSMYGHLLDSNELERLDRYQTFYSRSIMKTNYNHSAYFVDSSIYDENSGTDIDKNIDVTYVFFRSPRKVYRKLSPNPHKPGKQFSHIVTEEELAKNPLKEKETLQIRYIDDIYEGIVIGEGADSIVVNAGPKKYQVYDSETMNTQLPIIGKSFNDINDAPYSYIQATKDIQDLYNILMFQVELLTVISGVKGIVMDKAQIPDDLEPEEWVYQRKMGVAWIDTMKRKYGRLPTFNQFQNYDDTLSQSVMYILDTARQLDEMAGQIIGIPRQAIGQTVSTDQVGTNKMSIDQSALINEIQFYTHFDLLGKALTRLMNCARDQGVLEDVITFVSDDLSTDEFAIDKKVLNDSERKFDVIVSNAVNELEFMEDFKQIAMQERRAGQIGLHDLIKVYQGDTLKEMEATLEFASRTAIKNAQEAEANAQNAEAEKEARLKQMDLEYKRLADEMKAKLDGLKLQIEERKDQFNNALAQEELELKKQQQQFDNQIRAQEVSTNIANSQGDAIDKTFNNKLNAIKQQVDLLLGNRKLSIDDRKLDIEREKVDVERQKVKKMNNNPNSN